MDTTTTLHTTAADLAAEMAAHAELGGMTIHPRYGTTAAERAELRAAGYILDDECRNCGSPSHTFCNR